MYAMKANLPNETVQRIVMYVTGGDRIEGDVHVPRHARLIDILNHQADARPFLAVTDVVWRRGKTVQKHEFVSVHRHHIISLHPAE